MPLSWVLPKGRRGLRGRRATGALAAYYEVPAPDPSVAIGETPLLAVDVETTGLDPKKDLMLSIGWVPMTGTGIQVGGADYAVIHHPAEFLDARRGGLESAKIHGITHGDVARGEPLGEVLERFLAALRGRAMVVHFAPIETEFLGQACRELYSAGLKVPVIDTFALERRFFERMATYPRGEDLRLTRVRARYGLPRYRSHNALTDALACGELLLAMLKQERLNLSTSSHLKSVIDRADR